MGALFDDLRYAIRTLRANPGFTATAIVALAVGIGANTAIFSVVNATLVRPLPYRDPQQLVLIQEKIAKFVSHYIPVSAPDVLDFQARNRTLEGVGAFQNRDMNASGRSEPLRVRGARLTASTFPLLGVHPELGRTFTPEEDQPGRLVTVLSYGLWQRLFGADPHAIGAKLTLDGRTYEVVGVMPKSFVFPPPGLPSGDWPAELWVPMAFTKEELAAVADNFNLTVIGRRKPGVTVQRASADIDSVAAYISGKYKYGAGGAKLEARAASLTDLINDKSRTLLLLLLGSVAFVLLIACANVANLLLSRAASRRKEIAIRAALGATRQRTIRQLLTESIFLSLLGGGAGILLASWALSLLAESIPATIPRTSAIDIDPVVLGFAAGISLLTGIVFGIVPALTTSRGNVSAGLNETGRGSTAGKQRNRMRSILAAAEIALALVLAAGAGLLVRSFTALRNTDPGFRPERAVKMFVPLPAAQYPTAASVRAFDQNLLAKIGSLPGVIKAAAGSDLPLGGSDWNQIVIPEGMRPETAAKVPIATHTAVVGDYFQALGIALKRGRYLDQRDTASSRKVVVVNETLARDFWPGQDAVGKRLQYGGYGKDTPWREVVGVVADSKLESMESKPPLQFYEPYTQTREQNSGGVGRNLFFVVRTAGDPVAAAGALRMAVRSLDPSLPVTDLRTMTEEVDRSTGPRRFNTWVMGLFAGIALLLAAVGIYGVMAYSVAMKTQEIGIRMALGAAREDVLRMVIRQALLIAGAGIAVGLPSALALTRLMSGLLYGVRASDPLTFAAVPIFLTAVAIAATCFPALRAMRIDPACALRTE
jgi:putative ABC transport system permease protein